jgi:dihydroflavonol-4-reductase
MPTALVTGATGFLGSNLCRALQESGWQIRAFRRPLSPLPFALRSGSTEVIGDITDADTLASATMGCDAVFHAAALVSFSRRVSLEQHRVNVLGTRTVVNACLFSRVPLLIHTSSVAAIGLAPDGELADESTPLDRTSLHGYRESKVLAEEEVQRGIQAGLRAVIVNPAVIVGEGDTRFHGGEIIRAVKNGLVPLYARGGMNIVSVSDVVQGMLSAVSHGRTGERYILAGENLRHREIFERTADLIGGLKPIGEVPTGLLRLTAGTVELLFRALGKEPPLTADLAAVAGRTLWYSSEKARRELGFSSVPFDETILRAYDWYRKHGYL